VRVGEIDWMESADNYARIWVGAKSYLLRESLGSLQHRLAKHGFVRAHRKALVRLGAVRELARVNGGDDLVAVLTSGARVQVSRRKRAAMRESLA
jgi:two-component system, LytTR family, response regulator